MIGCLSLYCFLVFGPPSLALDPGGGAVAPVPASSIQAFGRANACGAWTDGCTICNRLAGQSAACSTPGIACTPETIRCTSPAP